MFGSRKKSIYEKELETVRKKESQFLVKHTQKSESYISGKLAAAVPEKLQETLDTAFTGAFWLVFDKGTGLIEKTYNRKEIENTFKINEYAQQLRQDKRSLRAFSKKAAKTQSAHTLMSGISGIGLGALGIGIPDIPVFTSMMLKTLYETALHYGYPYDTEGERYFILSLIQGAMSYGAESKVVDDAVNQYMKTGMLPQNYQRTEQIKAAACTLSKEFLCMKFLQGIPVVGAVGGACDMLYLKQITEYADIKYRLRFLNEKIQGNRL